jgi:putative transposase
MPKDRRYGGLERWAELRFSIIGPLLASPPPRGQLAAELARLADREWLHPKSAEPVRFAVSTLERWYYTARNAPDPVAALARPPRKDRGRMHAVTSALGAVVRKQWSEHPSWSYQLHRDNLAVEVAERPELGPLPSYSTLRRYLLAQGLTRRPRRPAGRRGEAERRAGQAREQREMRSFEAEYVGGLWHLDFHHASRKILTPAGEWVRPRLLAVLDDRSRLVCHAQWYFAETAETLVHGLTQAILKRGLPRALMSDNGGPMIAGETREGLVRLSILQHTTLPYCPAQNGKQEVLWAQVEGRLMAMLEGEPDVSLARLNEATQAWVEMEYQRTLHSETRQTPLERWLAGPSVLRPAPDVETLVLAFTVRQGRTPRRSDGTVTIAGRRFEVPQRFVHLPRLELRFADWDLSRVWLMDESAGVVLARLYPLDRARNADRIRRPITPAQSPSGPSSEAPGIAALLRRYLADYAATGLPPAYLPHDLNDDSGDPA